MFGHVYSTSSNRPVAPIVPYRRAHVAADWGRGELWFPPRPLVVVLALHGLVL